MNKDNETIVAYKGFDKNLSCRDYQYEVGKTYEHKGAVEPCVAGFHACEYPLDVLRYYAAAGSRFAIVEQGGTLARHAEDSKVASSRLTVKAEVDLPGLIKAAVEYTISRATPANRADNKEPKKTATNSGDGGAATNSGYSGAATNSGYSGAATNSGYSGAATNSGDSGAATNSGDSGAATNSGKHGIAADYSGSGRVKSTEGGAIILVHRKPWPDLSIVRVVDGVAGRDGIKPDTWYTLNDDGEMVEVE